MNEEKRPKCADCRHDLKEHWPLAHRPEQMCPQCYKICICVPQAPGDTTVASPARGGAEPGRAGDYALGKPKRK